MADISKIKVNDTMYDLRNKSAVYDYTGCIFYGTRDTAKVTSSKTATPADNTGFSFTAGVAVKFTYTSSFTPAFKAVTT